MGKVIIVILCLSLLVGCGDNHSTNTINDTSESDIVISDNSEDDSNITEVYTDVKLLSEICNDFVWIQYIRDAVQYIGILSSNGELTFETTETIEVGMHFANNRKSFTKNGDTFYITDDDIVHIVDKNGNELFNNADGLFSSLEAVGDNGFLVRKNITDYSENISYYGVLDSRGSWLRKLEPVYCGENTITNKDSGEVSDMGDNCYFIHFGQYENMVYNMDYGIIWADDMDVRNINSQFYQNKVLIMENGSWYAFWLDENGDRFQAEHPGIHDAVNYKGGLAFHNGFFYDYSGKVVIDFSQYDNVFTDGFVEKYAKIEFDGQDGERYAALIDRKGNFVVEPKQLYTQSGSGIVGEETYGFTYSCDMVCYIQNKTWVVYNLNTKKTDNIGIDAKYNNVDMGNEMLCFRYVNEEINETMITNLGGEDLLN